MHDDETQKIKGFKMSYLDKKYETEFKKLKRWLKFKPPLKYGWFLLKLYSMFQVYYRRLIETGFWRI